MNRKSRKLNSITIFDSFPECTEKYFIWEFEFMIYVCHIGIIHWSRVCGCSWTNRYWAWFLNRNTSTEKLRYQNMCMYIRQWSFCKVNIRYGGWRNMFNLTTAAWREDCQNRHHKNQSQHKRSIISKVWTSQNNECIIWISIMHRTLYVFI